MISPRLRDLVLKINDAYIFTKKYIGIGPTII